MTDQDKRVRVNIKEQAKGFTRDITVEISGEQVIHITKDSEDLGDTLDKSLVDYLLEQFDELTEKAHKKGITFVNES